MIAKNLTCQKPMRVEIYVGGFTFKEKIMPSNMGLQGFMERAKAKFGDRYDYSKVKYVNNSTPVIIICREHGEFEQTPNHHLDQVLHGCPRCGNKKVINHQDFIRVSLEVHGDKYDYSNANYVSTDTPVEIYCKSCGESFHQKPHYHVAGSNCPKCAGRYYKYLYILACKDLVKIGITNNPKRRIKQLRRYLDRDWKLLKLYETADNSSTLQAEKDIHFMLASFRYSGLTGEGKTEVFKLKDLRIATEVAGQPRLGLKEVSADGKEHW